MSNLIWNKASSREQAAQELAARLANHLQSCVENKGQAIVALSGGSTPLPMFKALATHQLDWEKIILTLVDERWVPESHELSNAAFLKSHLGSEVPAAQFIPLYMEAESVEQSVSAVLEHYADLTHSSVHNPASFDAVVLGMGGDGHTASFFPDAENVSELVDPETKQALLTCESVSTQVPRITWSLPVLLNTSFLALHLTGADKLEVFNRAEQAGYTEELPIRAVIRQQQSPVNIYYAD